MLRWKSIFNLQRLQWSDQPHVTWHAGRAAKESCGGEEKGKKLADGRRHIRQCHSTAAFLPLIANCSPPNLSLHVFTLILGLCWKTKSGGKKRVFKNCAHFKNLSAFTASDYSLAFLPHTLHDFGLIHRTDWGWTEMRSELRPLSALAGKTHQMQLRFDFESCNRCNPLLCVIVTLAVC